MVRLAALLGGLSVACDLANDFPPGKAMRTAVFATALARAAGLQADEIADVYYASLLRYLGCTGFAHEETVYFGAGDDRLLRNVMCMADAADPLRTLGAIVARLGRGAPALARARAVWRVVSGDAPQQHARAQTETSIGIAGLLGLSRLGTALSQVVERHDGRGAPRGLGGEDIAMVARVHIIADIVEIAHHREGRAGALAVLRRRRGAHFDPTMTAVALAHADGLFAAIERADLFAAFLDAEPVALRCDEAQVDTVARAFGFFADLKSVYTLGHSAGVATLCATVAAGLGLGADETRLLVRAAHLHDLGRLSVPNRIWDRPGSLGFAEWERVRLHAYYTERALSACDELRPLAAIAAAAHERIDGRGYPHRSPGAVLTTPARILAACDVAHAMGELRPHRPARDLDAIASALAEPGFDRRVVATVLAALGARQRTPPQAPAGLSPREVEVLVLLARGKTNREIGIVLGISGRTVQNHVAHIFDKLGVGSRAAAALFAMEHGLFALGDA
ncbi:MAG: LuxR C-terminal-related transcriptional regulator [Nannocystaceae bacterium]|nr:LuxR C-terminal-related transcriptional regulator [Nannocystaceae bacterium]